MSGVVSVGAALGASAIAATSVASVGMTMGSMFAVMGAVGAVAGAVGKLTGVKELAIGGAALGAVGGIGAVASSAGMFGAGEGLFSTGAGDVTAVAGPQGGYSATLGADGLGTTTGAAGGFNGANFFGAPGISTDVISSITGSTAPANTLPYPVDRAGNIIPPQGGGEGGTLGSFNNPAAAKPPSLIDTPAATASPPTTPLPEPVAAAQPPGAAPGNPPVSTGPYQATMPAGTDIPIVTLAPGQTQPTSAMPTGEETSMFGGLLKFMKDNPSLTMGGIMAASSFLSGAFNPKSDAEVGALNASAARNTADVGLIQQQTSLLSRQNTNMSQPVPRATRTRTNTGTGRIDRQRA